MLDLHPDLQRTLAILVAARREALAARSAGTASKADPARGQPAHSRAPKGQRPEAA